MFLKRPAFYQPDPLRRVIFDDDIKRSINEQKEALTVNLSKSTLEKLFSVAVPDPTDKKWLDEKLRMVQNFKTAGMSDADIELELRTNKPLGRDQRTTQKMENIATSSLSLSDKLKEIDEEIKSGRVVSDANRASLIGELAAIMTAGANLQPELARLSNLITALNVPTTYQALGIPFRIIDIDYYKTIRGLVNLLLFSKAKENPVVNLYQGENNVKRFDLEPKGGLPMPPIVPANRQGASKIQAAEKLMIQAGDQRRFLDLQEGGVINMTQIKQLLASGFDQNLVRVDPSYIV
jgi:hypothetical protein